MLVSPLRANLTSGDCTGAIYTPKSTHERAYSPCHLPEGYSRSLAENNLGAKLQDQGFRNDLAPLVAAWPEGYDLDEAANQVMSEVIAHI
jgi:hypothetical protein